MEISVYLSLEVCLVHRLHPAVDSINAICPLTMNRNGSYMQKMHSVDDIGTNLGLRC